MDIAVPQLPCYVAEWYRPEITAAAVDSAVAKLGETVASMSAEGSSVQLLMTMTVPSDEVVFCIFAAESEQAVARACRLAGFPVDRLTEATDTRIMRTSAFNAG
jgi:hypothetical protein